MQMIKIKIPIDAFSELSVFLQSHEQEIAENRENYELLKWVFECFFERQPESKNADRIKSEIPLPPGNPADTVFNSGLIRNKE